MNIYVVDENPAVAAQCLIDKHVIEMSLKTAQILSTINGGPYKTSHEGHPCVSWARTARGNYDWLVKHGLALCDEYTHRFGKIHKCREVIWLLEEPYEIKLLPGRTPFVQCMPELYKQKDSVKAYRGYYTSHAAFADWTNRPIPEWWMEDL